MIIFEMNLCGWEKVAILEVQHVCQLQVNSAQVHTYTVWLWIWAKGCWYVL